LQYRRWQSRLYKDFLWGGTARDFSKKILWSLRADTQVVNGDRLDNAFWHLRYSIETRPLEVCPDGNGSFYL